jgi:hypothetical protein
VIHKTTVFEERTFAYEGLFKLDEIYYIIDGFFRERDYDKYDRKHISIDGTAGKIFEIETHYDKEYSDNHSFYIEIDINCTRITEVTEIIDGKELKLHNGRFEIAYRGVIIEKNTKWEGDDAVGFKVIMNYLAHFFIFKSHIAKFKADALHDMEVFHELVLDYFNARKYMK